MPDGRTIAEFHATRTSGDGCPGDGGGRHYFAFLDPAVDHRICIDCGEAEKYILAQAAAHEMGTP